MKHLQRLLYRLMRWFWRLTNPITVGVRILAVQDDAVLLVKHTYQDEWYLPGGGVKKSETLEQAIRREAQEEVGGTIHTMQLFGAYSNFFEGKSDHITVFFSDSFSLTGETDHEIEAFDFFPLDALPPQTSPGSVRRIQEYVQGRSPYFSRW